MRARDVFLSLTFSAHGDGAAMFIRTGGSIEWKDDVMGSMVSGLADAVLGVVESVGLSADTVARYRKCCGVVVKFVSSGASTRCQPGCSTSSSRASRSVPAAVRSARTGERLW